MPIVRASRFPMPADFSSSKVNPRPSLTFLLYRTLGQRTAGLNKPATGRGAISWPFLYRLRRLRSFRAGWLNQVRTRLCQSLWKCAFGIILFPFGAILLPIKEQWSKKFDILSKMPEVMQNLQEKVRKSWQSTARLHQIHRHIAGLHFKNVNNLRKHCA